MKKLLLLAIGVMASLHLSAQAWTSVGVKAGYGLGFLYNQGILDDNSYNQVFSGSYNFGGTASVNLGYKNAIVFDVMLSRMQQKFNYEIGTERFDNEINWTNIDLYLLFRTYHSIAYLEIGPMMSLVQEVGQTNAPAGLNNTDVDMFYSDRYFSGVLGVGTYLAGSGKFTTILGLRFHFAFQDFVDTPGQNPEGFDFQFPNPHHADTSMRIVDPYRTYKKSLPIFAEVLVEFNFGLGYFAKAACSNRVKLFGG